MFSKIILCVVLVNLARGQFMSRIINGSPTTTASHPHQVSLQYGSGNFHICGGSVVRPNWVLTAAHCVEGSSASILSIGVNDGFLANSETYQIESIFMHNRYNHGSTNGAFPNDVALLKLANAIPESDAKSINMATPSSNFVGQNCKISGWGNTSNGFVDQLQETSGAILSDNECSSVWSRNYNGDVHICINNLSTGSCNGDSGGPMVCSGVLAGVTSWGAVGCRTDYPSVYARVSTFYDWANEIMNLN